ncbi:hypothetical protein QFC19_008291 [Naganishia cerealis]|uniref:Uncharacterized protein n=1 Tax=Naganishia cerealis TaxID=610337 RepID=A0ACC2V2I9_9TREE|nr:hypothetical protein QFC19_008291 [Naganishia cerealis]
MSRYAQKLREAKSILATLEGEKPHSSITDWVEILTSERYTEDSLDGVTELMESIRLLGFEGVTESSRAIRKKLKYGNVHRQIRALTILRALSENGTKGYQHSFANAQLIQRLREMATDVKRKLISVFHAWSLAYADDPKNKELAGLYAQYSGKKVAPPVARATPRTSVDDNPPVRKPTNDFENLEHSWAPSGGVRDTSYADYSDLREDAERRKREREARAALEAREAEIERRERAIKNKESEKAKAELYRQKLTEEEMSRRKQKERERLEKEKAKNQPKRPPFNFEKEKPQILISIANASQAAISLVNACRHVDRQKDRLQENLRVQDNLEKAKIARRPIIRYIQLVTDEEYVGTLLEANEKIVEAIQLYDKLCKPAELDSDSDHEAEDEETKRAKSESEMEEVRRRLAAQKLESQRTGEMWQLQERQKYEVDKAKERRAAGKSSKYYDQRYDEEATVSRLAPPMSPDETSTEDRGSLSDFSDYDDYSSDDQPRARSRAASRRQSLAAGTSGGRGGYIEQPSYSALVDDEEDRTARGGLLDPNDPFADPTDFLGSIGGGSGSSKPKDRMEWAAI